MRGFIYMITDADLENLPEDTELAFLQLEAKNRERLKMKNLQELQSANVTTACYVEYINDTLAADRALKLDMFKKWEVTTPNNAVYEIYPLFVIDVDHQIAQI